MKVLFTLSWRNIWRHGYRTIIAVLTTALGLAFAIPSYGLMEGLRLQMLNSITSMHLGAVQVHAKGYLENHDMELTLPLSLYKKLNNINELKGIAPRIYIGGMISYEKRHKVTIIPINTLNKCTIKISKKTSDILGLHKGSLVTLEPFSLLQSCIEIKVVDIINNKDDVAYISKQDVDLVHINSLTQQLKLKKSNNKNKISNDEWEDDTDIDLPKIKDVSQKTQQNKLVNRNKDNNTSMINTNNNQRLEIYLVRRDSSPIMAIGISPIKEKRVTTLYKKIVKGEYFNNENDKFILIGAILAKRFGLKVGDKVGVDLVTPDGFLMDSYFVVKGIFSTGAQSMDRSMIFVPLSPLSSFIGLNNKVHEFAISLYKTQNSELMAKKLSKILPSYDVKSWEELQPALKQMLAIQSVFLAIMLAIIFAIAAVGVMNVVLVSVIERKFEFGVLRAIGISPWLLMGLIVLETVMTLLLSGVIGGVFGGLLNHYYAINGIDFSSIIPTGFSFGQAYIQPVIYPIDGLKIILFPTILLLIVGVVFSLFPALRAAKVKPVDVMIK